MLLLPHSYGGCEVTKFFCKIHLYNDKIFIRKEKNYNKKANNLIYIHQRVNIEGDIYTLTIKAKKQ